MRWHPVRTDLSPEDVPRLASLRARIRLAHVLETETGYRSGSVFWAEEGDPRPRFDSACTTLTQRREAKVAELAALPSEDAKFLGLGQVGEVPDPPRCP
ncbi:hypothetical protein [Streptomyces phaeoluteigriseus]|nr:hypothetical protein [Streptomyces phaeoluteigriseus]